MDYIKLTIFGLFVSLVDCKQLEGGDCIKRGTICNPGGINPCCNGTCLYSLELHDFVCINTSYSSFKRQMYRKIG